MSSLEKATEDFEHVPVPDSSTVSGWKISVVKIGTVIALPAFMTGAELGAALGLTNAFLAMVWGGLILGVLASFTGMVAARSRLPTSLINQFAFGRLGAKVVNAVLAISLLGWFGVTASLFGKTLGDVLAVTFGFDIGAEVYMALGGALMVATTIFGFDALKKLSSFIVPVLFISLVGVVFLSVQKTSFDQMLAVRGTGLSFGLAISAVVGGLIASATIFPDICRFARNTSHALLAAAIGFVVAIPAVLIMGAIPSVATGENDLFRIMMNLGLTVPALIILVFAAWTTNSGNLYSTTLGLTGIFSRTAKWKLCVAAGTIGTIFAISGISDNFIPLLVILGIALPPVAGIYVADFFLLRGQIYDLDDLDRRPAYSIPAFTVWAVATAIAFATSRGVLTITGIPALDSVGIAFGLYVLLMRIVRSPARRTAPAQE